MVFKPGQTGNAGGLTPKQAKARKMIEGLSFKAIRRVDALMDSQDETIALAASKLVLDRVAPVPKQGASTVNIAVGAGHALALRAVAEKRALISQPVQEPVEVTATPLDRVSDSE